MFTKILSTAALATLTILPLGASAGTIIGSPGRYDGGRVSIQTQTGTSCSATAPDRASLGVAAGYENTDNYGYYGQGSGYDSNGLVGGVYVSMPFGGQPIGNCNTILSVEEQRARLDMAVTLFEAGAMTADELKALAEDVKATIQPQSN